MLGNVKDTEWSVLIMDTTTTPVMSSVCRISEILDYGVSCKAPPGIEVLSLHGCLQYLPASRGGRACWLCPSACVCQPQKVQHHPAVAFACRMLCRSGLQARSSSDGLLL